MWTNDGFEDGENSNQIAIALFRDTATNHWFVERVEFNLGATRTRTTFNLPQPLAQAFTGAFLSELTPHLPTSHERGLLADSQVHFAIAHLALVGIRVAAQSVFNGIQKVSVRFQRAFGSVQAMLLPRHRTEQAAENALHGVAASALLDLLLPCLDVLRLDVPSATSASAAERIGARLSALQEKKHDLEFYVGLLTRYLAHNPSRVDGGAPACLPEDAPSALKGFRLEGPCPVR